MDGIRSLTSARLLIRTKAQNKIDSRVRLLFGQGSCDVWVKECGAIRHNLDRKPSYIASGSADRVEKLSELGGRISIKTSEPEQNHFEDPLLTDLTNRMGRSVLDDRFDPFVLDEVSGWQAETPQLSQHAASVMSVTRDSHLKRPRGRPKKANPTLECTPQTSPSSKGLVEAHESWEMVKRLGISSNDESAVIAGIRKSKRILIMEESGP